MLMSVVALVGACSLVGWMAIAHARSRRPAPTPPRPTLDGTVMMFAFDQHARRQIEPHVEALFLPGTLGRTRRLLALRRTLGALGHLREQWLFVGGWNAPGERTDRVDALLDPWMNELRNRDWQERIREVDDTEQGQLCVLLLVVCARVELLDLDTRKGVGEGPFRGSGRAQPAMAMARALARVSDLGRDDLVGFDLFFSPSEQGLSMSASALRAAYPELVRVE